MAKRLLGFEGKVFHGAPGAPAATLVTCSRDTAYGVDPTLADVTDRGDSSAVPIMMQDVAQLQHTIEMEINNEDGNAFVTAVRAAANTGAALAIKTEDKAAGGYGVDGDYVIGRQEGQPLADAQRLNLTFTPTNKFDRTPNWS